MSGDRLVLAIDQGGHASRAAVLDGSGATVASAKVPIETRRPRPGCVEHDADALAGSVRDVVDRVTRDLGDRAGDVAAAGLATQRSSIACWDRRTGAALSPVLSWQDVRAAATLAALEPHAALVHERSGLVLSPHYGASKLRWCLEHLPAVRDAQSRGTLAFGPLASFLVFRLTRERSIVADPANAARTLVWSLAATDWCAELLALFDLPRGALPACVPSRHAFGHLDVGGREVPLTVVTGDQSAAVFGAVPDADVDPAVALVNIGTGAFVQRPVGARPLVVPDLLAGIVWHDGVEGRYVLEGTVNGAGSALEQVTGLDAAGAFAAAGRALQCPGEPPLYVNAVGGLGSPFWRSDVTSRFAGGPAGDAARLAAVVESIVFLVAVNLERMHAHVAPPRCLRATGGLAGLDGLCARLACLAQRPVERPATREATLEGLAHLIDATIPASAAHETFEPKADRALADRYRRWRVELDRALAERHEGTKARRHEGGAS